MIDGGGASFPSGARHGKPWLLGLDMGTDSIGWAAFDCTAAPERPKATRFRHGGVRLFHSGRDEKEHTSKQKDRGLKRRARRQPRARRWRKAQLTMLLSNAGLPEDSCAENPYALRRAALDRPLTGAELRRVLLHLLQHRGFRSNLLAAQAPDTPAREDRSTGKRTKASASQSKSKADDDAGFWRGAEQALRQRLRAEGKRTVGDLLASDLDRGRPVRMRDNRHDTDGIYAPTRALIAKELAAIRAHQEPAFPALDWEEITALVLEQRPLRFKDEGPCEFLAGETRCLRALPSAQRFIVLQTLANLRVPQGPVDPARPLTPEEHAKALALLDTCRSMTWPEFRKVIGVGRTKFTIETEAGGGKAASRMIQGNQTNAGLGALVPGWPDRSQEDRDTVFLALWSRRQNRRDLRALCLDPTGPLRLTDPDAAEAVADAIQFDLPTGRLSVSARAARMISSQLGPGVPWHEAVRAATGRDHSDRRPTVRLARLPYYAEIMPEVGMDGTHDPKHHNQPELFYGRIGNISVHIALNEVRKVVNALIDRYGEPPRLIVVETTRELKAGAEERKRCLRQQADREKENAAIDAEIRAQGGWLRNARDRRRRWRLWKRQKELCPYTGDRISGADLFSGRYEIDHVIPLSRGGRDSDGNMVLCVAEANRSKGDRTPWEAFGRLPGWSDRRDHFLAELDGDTRALLEWRLGDKAGARAAKYVVDDDGEGFLPRQLTDTGYIARVALRYLAHVVPDAPFNGVVATQGRLTAWLRAAWELMPDVRPQHLFPIPKEALDNDDTARAAIAALRPDHLRKALDRLMGKARAAAPPDATEATVLDIALRGAPALKNRADHRHHFVDAAVIAVTGRALVHAVNTLHGRKGSDALPAPQDLPQPFPEPYEGFRAEIVRAYPHIWPSLRPSHEAGGELHKETIYGVRPVVTQDGEPALRLQVRTSAAALFQGDTGKPLTDTKVREVLDSFVSDRMRARFLRLLDRYRDADPEASLGALCLRVTADRSWGPRGLTGNTVRVGTKPVGGEGVLWAFRGDAKAAVMTGNNAVYQVWETRRKNGTLKWEHRVLTHYDVMRHGGPETQTRAGQRLVMSLKKGDYIWIPYEDCDRLFRVKKFVTDGRLYIWPARLSSGKDAFEFVQCTFPDLNLNGGHGYKFSTADALRKQRVRPSSVSILGRLRVEDLSR